MESCTSFTFLSAAMAPNCSIMPESMVVLSPKKPMVRVSSSVSSTVAASRKRVTMADASARVIDASGSNSPFSLPLTTPERYIVSTA